MGRSPQAPLRDQRSTRRERRRRPIERAATGARAARRSGASPEARRPAARIERTERERRGRRERIERGRERATGRRDDAPRELRAARAQGRIANAVLYDPNFALRAYWDLGRRDATAIWIAQTVEGQVKCVDYCEGEGQAPGYYMNWLRANGYESAECVLPHDGARISPDNPVSMSYQTQLMGAGFKTRVVTNQGPAAAQQRIDAARRLFSRIAFHEDNCRAGLRTLAHYHEEIHEVTRAHMGPDHDWSSHGADAFGLLCIDYRAPSTSLERPLVPSMGTIA